MITTEHTKEALSRSYVTAIAGMAGVNLTLGHEFDYGFDGTFRPVSIRGKRRVESGYPLDFQLKCTENWSHEGDQLAYAIQTKTYNDLVSRHPTEVGAVLIVLCVSETQSDWVEFCEDYLTLRRCCYFMSLSGAPLPNEHSTKKILIPRSNILTGASLKKLLADERERKLGGKSDGK